MSLITNTDVPAGRAKHLGELAQVFRHRHGTWRDFGLFLKHLFKDTSVPGDMVGTTSGHSRMNCRHQPGGHHHTSLTTALASPVYGPSFNHSRYTRPCLSFGAFEEGKNGGLVVHDICIRAANFLASIGRGDTMQDTGRDFTYDPSSMPLSSSPLVGSSVESDASGDMDVSEDTTLTQAAFDVSGSSGDEFNDGGFFDDEDVREALGISRPALRRDSSSVYATDFSSSQDSAMQMTGRASSTKMRAATLGYLWGFADDPPELRTEFRRLRADKTLFVLHLCGCGLCFKAADDSRVIGCCEWTHLKLGSSDENINHAAFHRVLNLVPAAQYAQQVALLRGARDGGEVF